MTTPRRHDPNHHAAQSQVVPTHVVLGSGPVGRAVVAALVARGIEPVVVTRRGTEMPGAVSRTADVSRPDGADAAVAGAEVVFQCAQPPYHRWPAEFPALQRSIVGAVERSAALLVAAENLYGYGPTDGPLTEDLPLVATTRKGAVRAAMYRELEAAHRAGRIRMVAGRASDFFGPGVDASAVGGRFFGPLVRGKPVMVAGDPDALHTYTYVPDFGEALVRLSEDEGAWGRAWHVPNARAVPTREFAAMASKLAGFGGVRLRSAKPWMLRLAGLFQPAAGEVVEMLYEFEHDFVVDHSAYAWRFGDHATPLRDALAATVARVTDSAGDSRPMKVSSARG
jgi:nucleoside-diphosphate-sugar epimerase